MAAQAQAPEIPWPDACSKNELLNSVELEFQWESETKADVIPEPGGDVVVILSVACATAAAVLDRAKAFSALMLNTFDTVEVIPSDIIRHKLHK